MVASAKVEKKQASAAPEFSQSDKKPKREKAEKKGKSEKPTKYGRQELHVDASKSGRRRKKRGSGRVVSVSAGSQSHGFEKPTVPIVYEVLVPETISVADLAQ